jgi:hypothetical protein
MTKVERYGRHRVRGDDRGDGVVILGRATLSGRAKRDENGDISLWLESSGTPSRRINVKPGLNNAELWQWLEEAVGPRSRRDQRREADRRT